MGRARQVSVGRDRVGPPTSGSWGAWVGQARPVSAAPGRLCAGGGAAWPCRRPPLTRTRRWLPFPLPPRPLGGLPRATILDHSRQRSTGSMTATPPPVQRSRRHPSGQGRSPIRPHPAVATRCISIRQAQPSSSSAPCPHSAIHLRAALGSVRRAPAPTASYPPARLPPPRIPDQAVFDKLPQVLVSAAATGASPTLPAQPPPPSAAAATNGPPPGSCSAWNGSRLTPTTA